MEADAEIAALRAEVESLKTLVQQMTSDAAGGGDGFGPDFGLPITPLGGGGDSQGAFRFEGDKITSCCFYAAHQVVELADVTIQEGQADGTWYLNVSHASLSSATVSKTAGANDENNTCIPLFTVSNGAVTKDYRGMPFVPIYA